MRREADEIVSYIQKTVTQLHDSPHALWAALYFSAQHRALRAELEAIGALRRRIAAVRFTATAYASKPNGSGGGAARKDSNQEPRLRLQVSY